MSVIGSNILAGASGAGGGYQISRSVRLRSSASAYFNRTPASAGNRKTWTWSGWVKRGALAGQDLFNAYQDANNQTLIAFSSDTLIVYTIHGGGSFDYGFQTTAVFRDPSAWYHVVVVFDSANATAANRAAVYVNGVSQAGSMAFGDIPLNQDGIVNSTNAHSIGRRGSGSQYFDGYLTEINFIDGQALTPSSFGETNPITGVWQPKKYAGTYGTNGFYLNFSDNSAATAAAIGKDYSGNGNNWTPNNISVTAGVTYDSMLDVPTQWADGGNGRGNYCVLNPLNGLAGTLSNANLRQTTTVANWQSRTGTLAVSSGKWYWEGTVGSVGGNGMTLGGIAASSRFWNGGGNYPGGNADTYGYYSANGNKQNNGTSVAYGASYTNNDVIGTAFDLDAGTLTFYKNGVSQGVAFTGLVGEFVPAMGVYDNTYFADMNFGQRPFAYTPPSGFKALNTLNLPTPTILKGNQYFDATTYTGTGASLNVVNSGEMQPDFVWTKPRSTAVGHTLFDSLRGVTKYLQSNTTGAEGTAATSLTAFNSNGFTVNSDTSTGANGVTYVGWQWKAGAGSSSSNNSGSITSTVSVNPTAGFSVVTYTGTGANATVGHGLGVAPRMIIVKQRTALPSAQNWIVGHQSLSATPWNSYVWLDLTSAIQTASVVWNNTAPTSSVFSIGTGNGVNVSTGTYVAYCFAPIAGYSAFGSYTGNGSADGPFVFCGFRPKFIMIKSVSTVNSWHMTDTSRSPYNQAVETVWANESSVESTSSTQAIDILSNGFKIRNSTSEMNNSGTSMIYMAFAENPFRNSLAR